MPMVRQRGGFTLIELMISVAIIGTLAAIAVPGFQRIQLRSRAGEGRTNLGAIRSSEEAYFAEFGTYVGIAPTPVVLPGSSKAQWPAGSGFDQVGWAPVGTVQFQYAVTVPGGSAQTFTAEAVSDLDADGVLNLFGYVKEHVTGGPEVAGVFGCPNTGVFDPSTGLNVRYDVVGPCDANSGVSVF
jgi:type IV pilus assembly protein PilA